jgi:hypothetical protein
MPPKRVTLTETEWQHIYDLLRKDSKAWSYVQDSELAKFAPIIIGLNGGILKKFDEAPDLE